MSKKDKYRLAGITMLALGVVAAAERAPHTAALCFIGAAITLIPDDPGNVICGLIEAKNNSKTHFFKDQKTGK